MKSLSAPKWRPEIQGLGAVAVLLVIVYHAGLLDGGFVGVDVFFVISGHLISAQLYAAPADRPGRALLDVHGGGSTGFFRRAGWSFW